MEARLCADGEGGRSGMAAEIVLEAAARASKVHNKASQAVDGLRGS